MEGFILQWDSQRRYESKAYKATQSHDDWVSEAPSGRDEDFIGDVAAEILGRQTRRSPQQPAEKADVVRRRRGNPGHGRNEKRHLLGSRLQRVPQRTGRHLARARASDTSGVVLIDPFCRFSSYFYFYL